MYRCSFNRKYCRIGKRKLNYFGPMLKVTMSDEPTLATMNRLTVTRWGAQTFCAAALKGSCESRSSRLSQPPIPSPQQQKPLDAQVTPPQPWQEHIPHGWSGFYKRLGTDTLTWPFLSSWFFSASMEKSSHQCSAFWNTWLKIEQIPRLQDFRLLLIPGFPSPFCHPVKSLCSVFMFSARLCSEHLHALLHCNDI